MRILVILITLFIAQQCWSQDYHHWSEHFGARASLLGGAATAGLGDNSTVYYNPAAMAYVEDPSISISVNAYRLRRITLENALGPDLDLKGTQFSTMPNLIAGIVEFKKAKKLRLGYSVITRKNFSGKFDYLYQGNYNVDLTPQPEIFAASYNYHHQMNEFWAGFGLSYALSKNISIGFAHYGIYRDVKYTNTHKTTVMPADQFQTNMSSVSSNLSFNYYNIKGVFKPSIAINTEKFKFGISLTTPSFNMFGKASVYRDFIVSDIILGIDASAIDRADNIKATHKENGSLAIGVSWKIGEKAWMHFTNETFFGGKKYMIFDVDQRPNVYPNDAADSAILATFGGQNFLSFGEERKWTNNFGLGLEIQFAKKWMAYLGARTDFNYNEDPYYVYLGAGNISASKWDIYHFSLGLVHITKNDKRYTVGVEYGHTPKTEYTRILDYTTSHIFNYLMGTSSRGAFVNQSSFKVLMEIEIGKKKLN